MARLNWYLIGQARDLWDPDTTLADARERNPEYLRAQVETITAATQFEDGDDSEVVQEDVAQAIFCRWAVVVSDNDRPDTFVVRVFDTRDEAHEWAVTNPHYIAEVVPAIDPH